MINSILLCTVGGLRSRCIKLILLQIFMFEDTNVKVSKGVIINDCSISSHYMTKKQQLIDNKRTNDEHGNDRQLMDRSDDTVDGRMINNVKIDVNGTVISYTVNMQLPTVLYCLKMPTAFNSPAQNSPKKGFFASILGSRSTPPHTHIQYEN